MHDLPLFHHQRDDASGLLRFHRRLHTGMNSCELRFIESVKQSGEQSGEQNEGEDNRTCDLMHREQTPAPVVI